MRSLWSGSISFGLINIPIQLYSASRDRVFNFEMLHKDDLSPISFMRVCRKNGEEVPYEEVVKGYEYREGDYVVLKPEDFKRAAPKESETIEIQEFVEESEIDSKYYKKPYFLEPEKGSGKAYLLLREALEQTGKVAIAKMVFREHEDLVAIKTEDNLLILNQLRYNDEIRETTEIKVPKSVEISKQEIEMAVKLIGSMRGKFEPKKYKDTYSEKLQKVIQAKARGEKLKQLPKISGKQVEPEDLIGQLRASLTHSH